MSFSGVWRDYQQRVLDEFDAHAVDHRVHVVAAPGSGKTVLGLELARRIGRPALVLSPTRTIRDQWLARLVPLFLPAPPLASAVSASLEEPASLTTATYQALHAHWADEGTERFEELLKRLHAIGPVTLILDEAHHLRREWWNALQALVDALPEAKLIALTATPPYDAPFVEWSRYETLCGPIDLEIGIPELVRNGDLCPHQDHILLSPPGHDALELLERRRRGIALIREALLTDAPLLDFFMSHPWLVEPKLLVEEILEAPEMLSAVLVHIATAGRSLPAAPLRLLGVRRNEMPMPSAFWLQVLLNGVLFGHKATFPIGEERIKWLRATLGEYGLIEGGKVKLTESRKLFTLMASDLAKLNSIAQIARTEAAELGQDLRMAILSDHVRAGELPRAATATYKPAKLGVVPIFETLRRAAGAEPLQDQPIAVLTGSLTIVPEQIEPALRRLAATRGIGSGDLALTTLPGCPGYLRLASVTSGHSVVELVTALFLEGHIRILIGTQALLGEGWDAPAINSLVLASNSAAFMLSNQMRGRAIRIDPSRPDKVANIWHLATVEQMPGNAIDELRTRLNWGALDTGEDFTSDYEVLQRRFRAFEGIANSGSPQIESGIVRLGLHDGGGLEAANARTLQFAADRRSTAERWSRSLGLGTVRSHTRETASPTYIPRGLSWHDTLRWLTVSGLSSGGVAAANELRNVEGSAGAGTLLMALAGAGAVAALPKLAKAGWLAFRNGSVEGSLEQVAMAVLAGLQAAGTVSADVLRYSSVEVRHGISGRKDVILHGVSRASEHAVMTALAELLGPVQNPRYLLVRRTWFGRWRRADYHAVPTAIGRRKEWAEAFHRAWKSHVGDSELVFTRSADGRLALLRARAQSLAAGFQRRVDRRSAWL